MYSFIATRSAAKAVPRLLPCAATRYQSTRNYSSTMHDNDAEVLDREKFRNLSKSQHKTSTPIHDAPGWNEHLASASEAHIKADRSSVDPKTLQRQTVEYIHSRHSPDERVNPREAVYTHDQVSGPLSTASIDQFEGIVQEKDVAVDEDEMDVAPDGTAVKKHIHEEKKTTTIGPN